MENLRSSARASTPSLILRVKLRLLVRKMLRASCCVIVEVALTRRLLVMPETIARPIPIGSTPMWLRNRRSSTAIIAARISGGIWS